MTSFEEIFKSSLYDTSRPMHSERRDRSGTPALSADEIWFRLPSPPLTHLEAGPDCYAKALRAHCDSPSSVHLVGKVERDARAESIRAQVS